MQSAEDEAPPAYSLTFSGRGAENNRFLAEFWPQHHAFESDYALYALEPEAFARQVKQRRQDEFALLAEGREKYALSLGFIDYMTTFFNYKWADKTVSYSEFSYENGQLTRRMSPDGSHRRAVPSDYYDFLQEIPLIDEKAIGVGEYRRFLVNTLALEAKSDGPCLNFPIATSCRVWVCPSPFTHPTRFHARRKQKAQIITDDRSVGFGSVRGYPKPNLTPCTKIPERAVHPKRPFGWGWSYRPPP